MGALEDRDLRILRRLVSEHYHAPRTLERLIPARTEQVTETVVEDEPYTETYEVETGQCTDNKVICVLRWLKWAALLGIKVAFVLPLAAVGLLASEDVDEADDSDGSGDGNGRLSVPERAGLLWDRYKQEFRERTTDTEIRHETRTRKVEREVTREVELEPERTVRETESSSRRIVSLGRGRLAFHASSTPVGTIVTGPQGLMSHVTTRFPIPRDFEGVYRADEGIRQALDRVPWALSGEAQHHTVPGDDSDYAGTLPLRGLERELVDHFEEMGGLLSDLERVPMAVSFVDDAELISLLSPAPDAPTVADSTVVDLGDAIESRPGQPLEELTRSWLSLHGEVGAALFQARSFSLCGQLAPECLALGNLLNYSAFNFYCPECNRALQDDLLSRSYSVHNDQSFEPVTFSKNTRCVYHPANDVWRCLTCGQETKTPIPMHRMLDEVLLPAYDHLMNENKLERVKAHRDAREKEINNGNSMEVEIERIQMEYGSQLDALGDELERLESDISGENLAIDSMREILSAYNAQQTDSMERIREFSESVDKSIHERTERVLARIDEVKAQQMETLAQELQSLSRAKRVDDERRDEVQRQILTANIETAQATREQVEVSREGFRQVTSAVEQTTAAVEQTTAAV